MMPNDSGTGSQSVDRATELLAIVAEHHREGATMSLLIERTGLKRPTIHRLLGALTRAGLVEHDPAAQRYALGAGSYALGTIAADRFGLHPLAETSVRRLAEVSGDTAFFCVRKAAHSVCLTRIEGRHPIRSHILDVGQSHPLGVAAHGIAMLAALDEAEAKAVIDLNAPLVAQKYPKLTPEFLREIIAETRERGWAINRGFFHERAWAVGYVVRGIRGEVAGALSIGAMEDRLQGERQEEIAGLLAEEARLIERRLRRLSGLATPATPPAGGARSVNRRASPGRRNSETIR